ncbi:hypothetical protein LCGC14_1237870, partial [marine sediment metagenome]
AIQQVHRGHIVIAAAILQTRFHYDEHQMKLVGNGGVLLVDELLDRADDLEPELQDLLVKFAAYMGQGIR